jgi:hypothetical protein
MLDYLKQFKSDKYDFLTFLEGDEEDTLSIATQEYANPGEPVGSNAMGDSYHVVLFRTHETEDKYIDLDYFIAILSDPLEYISGLIKGGFFGIIARQTTTSKELIDRIVDKMKEV